MNIIKKLLEKIKIYLNNLFNRQSIKMLEATTSNVQNTDTISSENRTEDTEKDDFFIIYNNVKNGTIKITDLMIDDLIKVMAMMHEEINVFNEKINNYEKEIFEMDTEIKILERQNVEFQKIN